MSVESRMITRASMESLLTLAGWGMGIAGVVMLFLGNPGAGVVLIVGAVVAFGVSAASSKRKTTGHYAAEQMDKAMETLKRGKYPEALAAARKAVEIAQSVEELRPGMSAALLLLATARAVTGDEYGARRDVSAARANAFQFPGLANEILPLAVIIERELDRGVPAPGRLVADVLEN